MVVVQRVDELSHAHLTFFGHHKELRTIRMMGYTVRVSVRRNCNGHLFFAQQLSATELSLVTHTIFNKQRGIYMGGI